MLALTSQPTGDAVSDTAAQAASGYPSIMVFMDRSSEASNLAKIATALADRFSARLVGVAAQPIAVPMYYEAPIPGVESEIELEEQRVTSAIPHPSPPLDPPSAPAPRRSLPAAPAPPSAPA